MPRTKKQAAGDPESPPEGMAPEVWALGLNIGNVAVAQRLIDVADGGQPADESEIPVLIETSAGLESKALKRYLKLKASIGGKLASALAEYQKNRKRTGRLSVLLDSENGGRPTTADVYGAGNGAGQ